MEAICAYCFVASDYSPDKVALQSWETAHRCSHWLKQTAGMNGRFTNNSIAWWLCDSGRLLQQIGAPVNCLPRLQVSLAGAWVARQKAVGAYGINRLVWVDAVEKLCKTCNSHTQASVKNLLIRRCRELPGATTFREWNSSLSFLSAHGLTRKAQTAPL
jgi:hypothetical protein